MRPSRRAVDTSTGSNQPAGVRVERTRLLGVVAFGVALTFSIASVWSVEYFPTQDGPAHVELARVWAELGTADAGRYADFFEIDAQPAPYWTANLVLRGLVDVFDAVTLHKIMVTLLIVGFAGAAWYAMGAIRRSGTTLAVLAVPLATGWYLHKGFFNFVAGVCLLLVVVGFYLRNGRSMTPAKTIWLGLLLVATYFSHLVPLVAAWLVLGVLSLALATSRPAGERSLLGRVWQTGRHVVAAAVPSALLVVGYLTASSGLGVVWALDDPLRWLRRVASAATLYYQVVSFDRVEWVFGIALAILVGMGVAVALTLKIVHRRWSWEDGLLGAAALLTLAANVAPIQAAGGSLIRERIYLFPFLLVLVWLAGQDLDSQLGRVMIVGGLAVSLALVGVHVRAYRLADREIREIVSAAEHVQEGSVIVPISFIDFTDPNYARVRPLLHTPSWIAVDRSAINLGNPWPSTSFSHIRYRPALDPDSHLLDTPAGFQTPPPRGDVLGYEAATGQPIHYVLLIGLDREPGYEREKEQAIAEISAVYEAIHETSDGLARLFGRRVVGEG